LLFIVAHSKANTEWHGMARQLPGEQNYIMSLPISVVWDRHLARELFAIIFSNPDRS